MWDAVKSVFRGKFIKKNTNLQSIVCIHFKKLTKDYIEQRASKRKKIIEIRRVFLMETLPIEENQRKQKFVP